MPARLTARFKRDQILMPQFVDDLPRRDTALSRRACHHHVSAGPGGKIGERTGECHALDRMRRVLGKRVVDGRNDAEDVDRNVDGARDRRDVRRLQPAVVIGTVGKDDDRAPATLALADPARGQRDRVVKRGGAERHDRRHRIRQRPQARREGRALVEVRIERVDGRLIARRVEPAQDVHRRFACVRQMAFHAAADVEEHGDADAGEIALKIADGPRLAAVEHLEIARRQVLDEAPFRIADHCRDPDHVDARFERRHRRGDILCLGGIRAKEKTQDEPADDELAPRHRTS